MSFEENVRRAAEKFAMLENTGGICCGLSGGADSVSLLLILRELQGEYGFKLTAVHVNHRIRGKESERDKHFCEDLCGRLGVPIEIREVDAPAYSKERGLSLEEGSRELRYGIFREIAAAENCRIATAHTLNDSAETVIFNLARGTGIKGLTGIPPVRDKIIRPLIFCTREEVEDFLARKGQDFVTDSSNLSDDYTRNRIRHKIIPLMEELHGGFLENIRRMTENLAEASGYLEAEAEKYSGADLRELHGALKSRIIANALKNAGAEVNSSRIGDIEKLLCCGGKINLSGELYALVTDGRLSVKKIRNTPVIFEETPVKMGENPFLCDKTVIIEANKCEKSDIERIINNSFTKDGLDYDKIQGDVVLRNRRNGDKYIRVNRSFKSSLKKLMNESIPLGKRDFIPVLADGKGIIWVEGFGIADRVKIDENTKNVMFIRIAENGRN